MHDERTDIPNEPKKMDESDKQESRRLKIIAMTTCLLILLFLLLLTIIIILILNWDETSDDKKVHTVTTPFADPEIKKLHVISLSEECQKKFGQCYYYPLKYASCDVPTCFSVYISPVINYSDRKIDKYVDIKLLFYATNLTKQLQRIPNAVQCKVSQLGQDGICVNGVCKGLNESDKLFAQKQPVDGGWSDDSRNATCLLKPVFNGSHIRIHLPALKNLWKDRYLKWISCDALKNIHHSRDDSRTACHPYRFRSCTNSVPSFGGEACWIAENFTSLNFSEWPLRLSKRCPNCNETLRPSSTPVCRSFITPSCSSHNVEINGTLLVGSDFRPSCTKDYNKVAVFLALVFHC